MPNLEETLDPKNWEDLRNLSHQTCGRGYRLYPRGAQCLYNVAAAESGTS